MSDDSNLPVVKEQTANDFSTKDLEIIQAYQEKGLEGIGVVDDKKMGSMLEMYLSGKTYRQIATTMQLRKEIVLYMSHKFNWFEIRNDYFVDMERSMRPRVLESKIVDQDFMLQLQAMWRKKIGTKMSKYFATGNEEFINDIDLKEIGQYLKTVEMLHKLAGDKAASGDNNRPMVGLNAGDGVTIVKTGENSVEITPKSKAIGDALKMFADARREEENKK